MNLSKSPLLCTAKLPPPPYNYYTAHIREGGVVYFNTIGSVYEMDRSNYYYCFIAQLENYSSSVSECRQSAGG